LHCALIKDYKLAGKEVFAVQVKKLNLPKGNSTSGLSIRGGVQSGESQGARATIRARNVSAQEQQSSAFQINVAYRKFFIEDDFNDITIEELAKFMERDDDFVEPEEEKLEAQQQPQQTPLQQPLFSQEPTVNKRQAFAADAYNWFATLP